MAMWLLLSLLDSTRVFINDLGGRLGLSRMLAFSPAHEIKNKSVGFTTIHTRPYEKMPLIHWSMVVHVTARLGVQVPAHPFSTIMRDACILH